MLILVTGTVVMVPPSSVFFASNFTGVNNVCFAVLFVSVMVQQHKLDGFKVRYIKSLGCVKVMFTLADNNIIKPSDVRICFVNQMYET